jgi:hypothetical protein
MLEKVVWYLLFATLALAGVWVCLSPAKLAQLLGASDVIPRSKRVKVWRVLGLVVLVGSIVELVMMATGIRR